MSLFSDNLNYLRTSKNWSQQDVADKMLLKLARYNTYETGRTEPPYEILIGFSVLYTVTIDAMLTINLRKVNLGDVVKIGNDRFYLPIIVDREGENLIDIVPEKARAGYLAGSINQEYVEQLQKMSFPTLKNGIFRTFQIGGDSMSFENNSFITGKLVESLNDIKDGKTYIVITNADGMAYKRLYKKGNNSVIAESDNPLYEPYTIMGEDIWEIWEFEMAIEFNDEKRGKFDLNTELLIELKNDMRELKSKLNS